MSFVSRRIGRWLTPIKPLIPMMTSSNCTFTMKTVPWAMAWKPSLRIQLSQKIPEGNFAVFLICGLSYFFGFSSNDLPLLASCIPFASLCFSPLDFHALQRAWHHTSYILNDIQALCLRLDDAKVT